MDDTQYNQPPPLPPPGQSRQMPPPPYPQPPPPRGSGMGATFIQSCLVAGCATIVGPLLLVIGFFVFAFFMASSSGDEASSAFDSIYEFTNLRENVLRAGTPGSGTIALVTLHGAIDGDGSPLEGTGMMAFVSEQLRAAGNDDSVRAVILQIDSPGGGLTASDHIYNEVLKLRDKGKKVIAWAGSIMASGGYYVAAAADGIIASPTATIGSIGVIMQHFQVQDMLEKLGIKVDPVTSGARKDLGSIFREMTPEEKDILQGYIDASHRRFVELVAKGRKMEAEDVMKLADGRIFTAPDSLDNGLIDRIGYIDAAVEWVEELSGESGMRIVAYRRQPSFRDLFQDVGMGAAEAVLEAGPETGPRAMAVWDGK